jgi:hypothetical protein
MARTRSFILFTVAFILGALAAGCRTPCHEEQFGREFDAKKVAQLAHDAFKIAWPATHYARHDLRFGSYRPTKLDREVIYRLDRIRWQAPWVAREVERNPSNARCASKSAYDVLALEATMLRTLYRPDSFTLATDAKIESLLGLIDQLSVFYELKTP